MSLKDRYRVLLAVEEGPFRHLLSFSCCLFFLPLRFEVMLGVRLLRSCSLWGGQESRRRNKNPGKSAASVIRVCDNRGIRIVPPQHD